jgi:hypothetical protein
MAPTIAGDVIRAVARHEFAGVGDVINVLHFQIDADPAAPDDLNLLSDLALKLGTDYALLQAFMSSEVVAKDITVYNVSQDYPLGVTGWGAGYVGGTSGADSLPPGISCMILLRTAKKFTTGKIYLPPTVEAYQSAGTITAGYKTNCTAFINSLRDTTPGAEEYGFRLRVWSRTDDAPVTIVSTHVEDELAYQRRRKVSTGS